MSLLFKKILLATGIALWLAGAAWGMKWVADYSFTPGHAGAPSRDWPEGAARPEPGRFTVVVGLHPECPCSRATLAELDSILVEGGDAIRAVLIFSDAVPEEPAEKSALYQRAAAFPRTRLVCDATGAELRRFAFRTSGETRLYRPDGQLVFRGGITGSRGHEGDNPGRAALLAAVRTRTGESPPAATPVFGCGFN